jgi:hypothetical protein
MRRFLVLALTIALIGLGAATDTDPPAQTPVPEPALAPAEPPAPAPATSAQTKCELCAKASVRARFTCGAGGRTRIALPLCDEVTICHTQHAHSLARNAQTRRIQPRVTRHALKMCKLMQICMSSMCVCVCVCTCMHACIYTCRIKRRVSFHADMICMHVCI